VALLELAEFELEEEVEALQDVVLDVQAFGLGGEVVVE
jgi:hypothetical protein